MALSWAIEYRNPLNIEVHKISEEKKWLLAGLRYGLCRRHRDALPSSTWLVDLIQSHCLTLSDERSIFCNAPTRILHRLLKSRHKTTLTDWERELLEMKDDLFLNVSILTLNQLLRLYFWFLPVFKKYRKSRRKEDLLFSFLLPLQVTFKISRLLKTDLGRSRGKRLSHINLTSDHNPQTNTTTNSKQLLQTNTTPPNRRCSKWLTSSALP